MPFHVVCYLGQNERVVNLLAITKWLVQTTAHGRQIQILPPSLEKKTGISPFLERSFFLVLYSNNSDRSHFAYSLSRRDQENVHVIFLLNYASSKNKPILMIMDARGKIIMAATSVKMSIS